SIRPRAERGRDHGRQARGRPYHSDRAEANHYHEAGRPGSTSQGGRADQRAQDPAMESASYRVHRERLGGSEGSDLLLRFPGGCPRACAADPQADQIRRELHPKPTGAIPPMTNRGTAMRKKQKAKAEAQSAFIPCVDYRLRVVNNTA